MKNVVAKNWDVLLDYLGKRWSDLRGPVWSSTTPTTLSKYQGDKYDFGPYVYDPDDDAVVVSLVSPPAGYSITAAGVMTIGSVTGNVTMRATDPLGLYSDRVVTVSVQQPSTGTADFIIPTTTSTWDGAVAQTDTKGVKRAVTAGSVVEIARGSTGTRGPLTVKNLKGNSTTRSTLRGDRSGVTTIRRSSNGSGGFVFHVTGSRYLNMDFYLSGAPEGRGVVVTYSSTATPTSKDNCSSFVKLSSAGNGANTDGRTTDNVTISYLEVKGGYSSTGNSYISNGVGIQMHDNDYMATDHRGVYQDNSRVLHCKVTGAYGEGIYFGPNFYTGAIPLKNCEVGFCHIEMTGREALQGKSWINGSNSVHDNVCINVGMRTDDQYQGCGMSILYGSCNYYNNRVYTTKTSNGHGLQAINPAEGPGSSSTDPITAKWLGWGYTFPDRFTCYQWNNIATDVQDGISITSATGRIPYEARVYNCTTVNNRGTGIRTTNTAGTDFVRNCVSVGNATAISGSAAATNNTTTGTPASIFVDPNNSVVKDRDFHLLAEIAATGTIGTDISATDIDGTSRSGTASRSAYEYA